MEISVVIPVKNEEESIPILVPRLIKSLDSISSNWEAIFVTDLNKDNTFGALKKSHETDSRIKVIKLSNCFGQHIAVYSAFKLCKGDSVVVMDGDLEVRPEDIPKLHKKMKEGYDIVHGYSKTKNNSFFNDLLSRLFNRVMNYTSDFDMDNNSNMFRIISRKALDEIIKFKEYDPSLTYIMGLINLPSTGIKIDFDKRQHGETEYSLRRKINFAINSLISFSTKPLRLISVFGFVISFISFLYLLLVVIQKLFVEYTGFGLGTVIVLIIFFGGLQLFAIGIIGEYIGRIFIQSKDRPRYIVEEKIGVF